MVIPKGPPVAAIPAVIAVVNPKDVSQNRP